MASLGYLMEGFAFRYLVVLRLLWTTCVQLLFPSTLSCLYSGLAPFPGWHLSSTIRSS